MQNNLIIYIVDINMGSKILELLIGKSLYHLSSYGLFTRTIKDILMDEEIKVVEEV